MGKKKKYKSSVYKSLAVITQFGINMLVPIFLCSFGGLFIDRRLNTSYWFIILFFVGALAGFRNIYILAKKIYEGDKDGDKQD
jgi:F0F1-type ATP synthase assembly protein I